MQFKDAAPGIPPTLGARVDQLAAVLATDETTVTALLADAGHQPERGHVSDEAVRSILAEVTPRRSASEVEPLLENAFLSARNSGKTDWQVMQISVLKNRLLLVTDKSFDEANFGFPNMHYLVREFPSQLEVLPTAKRPTVRYVGVGSEAAAEPAAKIANNVSGTQPVRSVVRPDLWSAALDYKAGEPYFWNLDNGIASRGNPHSSSVLFPTVDSSVLQGWRKEFVASLEPLAGELAPLTRWVDTTGATGLLAPKYRGLWNGFLRDRVIERISAFFVANNLKVPSDLVSSRQRADRPSALTLREQLHQMLDALSEEELKSVIVPAHIVLRLSNTGK